MFEFEVDHARLPASALPDEVKALFRDLDAEIEGVALLPWEEHCTECAMPLCYRTCDLYVARKDGHCRRFVAGFTPIRDVPNLQDYVVRVAFKRWGEMLAEGSARLVPVRKAERAERLWRAVEEAAASVPDGSIAIGGRRGPSSRLVRRAKRRLVARPRPAPDGDFEPDYFVVEVHNPNDREVPLSLTIRNPGVDPPFQELLTVAPGFQRFKIDYRAIRTFAPGRDRVMVSLNPNLLNAEDEGLVLDFGLLTFVRDTAHRRLGPIDAGDVGAPPPDGRKFVKVLAWDLDNTLWRGTILEDGAENVDLFPGIPGILRELDRRGILNTVASKNYPEEALALLRKFGLLDYFLFPKIGWETKGESIRRLVREFNLGEDTFAFIDDSPFEREQARSMNPKLRVYPAEDYRTLLERAEFRPTVTEESSRRRSFYRDQGRRDEVLAGLGGDYDEFLRASGMRLNVHPATIDKVDRIHELVQRTNQLNFSGTRYSLDRLGGLLQDHAYEALYVDCADRFGAYGIVGFCVVDRAVPRMVDLMFSCRIQAKRVEHAFLGALLAAWKARGATRFEARYVRTERNEKAGQVFDDLAFTPLEVDGPTTILGFDLTGQVPTQAITTVVWEGQGRP